MSVAADPLIDFVAELRAHAVGRPALIPIITGLTRAVRVSVCGRTGVGVRTVGAALRAAGLDVCAGGTADVRVLVLTETAKPEDEQVCATTGPALLIVLNKADLLTDPAGRAAAIAAHTARPVVPMSALPAIAQLDSTLLDAVRTLAGRPADLSSVHAFRTGAHPVPADTRERLLTELDRAGIAALAADPDRDPAAVLRTISNVDAVLAGIAAAAAPRRYRRLRAALTRLAAQAARTGDDRLAGLLAGDSAVFAAMTLASEVLAADGPVAGGDSALQRAVRWRRYSRGPVDALRGRCGVDIARGAVRLAARDGLVR